MSLNVVERQSGAEEQSEETWLPGVACCPACRGELTIGARSLRCKSCRSEYAVEQGIPAMLSPRLDADIRGGKEAVKSYYLQERYDWTRDPKALEFAYHRYRKWVTWRRISRLLKPEGMVLDLGCGTGLITRQFIGHRQTVLALDMNPWALSRMDGKPWVIKIQADAELLPIRDSSVSLVVVTEVIEHLEAPERAAREIFRVSRRGARVIGSVPSTSNIWKLRRYLSLSCGGGEPFHNSFTRTDILDLWRSAGFKARVSSACIGMNWMFILEKP
ncbi:MAG: methyltransferase domain-containing protein [Chloroflexi bacterium]|nr:methyltransferase domain-containing protein [Chloroflexota bacterium]